MIEPSTGTLPMAPSDQIPKRAPKNGSHIQRADKIIPVRKVTLITYPNKVTLSPWLCSITELSVEMKIP